MKKLLKRTFPALLLLAFCAAPPREGTQILWDKYGIPHIYADSDAEMFRAFGWAQMHSHGDLILRLYAESRGRAAEYWGEDLFDSDRWMHLNGIPERAEEWAEQIDPQTRGFLQSFADGMNEYAREHADAIDDQAEKALPVTPEDILCHMQRTLHFTFLIDPNQLDSISRRWEDRVEEQAGSNAWAVGPSRAEDGHALLLANPHLPWQRFFLFYEAHLNSPSYQAYGVTLVGLPTLGIAFNEHLGWTHTVNTIDATDIYELTVQDGGYLFDGEVKPFEETRHPVKVRKRDGSLEEREILVRHSVHGPVVAEERGRALALRVAGLDRPGVTRAWWDLARTKTLQEFQNILKRMELPLFTVMYADKKGNIMHFFGGLTPRRTPGYDYGGIVPGDTSETLWDEIHGFEDMPIVLNPDSGWLQNANDPPWTTTTGDPLDPSSYPDYLAPRFMHLRAQRSFELLNDQEKVGFEEMIRLKHSTHLEAAERVLDELVPLAREQGGDLVRKAADVLESWDLRADAESRGTVLFESFYRKAGGTRVFAAAWDPQQPLTTPDGIGNPQAALRALEEAAQEVAEKYGELGVPWGDVNRLKVGDLELPGNGADGSLGAFRVVVYRGRGKKKISAFGDSYVLVVEFADPIRARAVLSYGNSSQPGSPHLTDQLQFVADQQLREVWLARDDILDNLERQETLR